MTTTTRRVTAALRVLCVVAACLGAQACGPDPSTARGTAERFLDAHYVHIDLPAALPFTSGVARQKVETEMELVRGVEIDETTRKPVVHYTLLEEQADGGQAVQLVYRGRVALDGGEAFERRWLVTVRREPDGWRVTNYQEFEQ